VDTDSTDRNDALRINPLELASRDQTRSEHATPPVIHMQEFNRCSTHRCCPDDLHPDERKMPRPGIPSRVKEFDDPTGERIEPNQIRTLAKIAITACESEIIRVVAASVLTRANVLDVERDIDRKLRQTTIFAPKIGALSDEPACRGIHQDEACRR
jgi:hypothetical protein